MKEPKRKKAQTESHLPPAADASQSSCSIPSPAAANWWASLWFRLVVFCGFAGISLLLYGHTLSFPFVFDDRVYLVDNPLWKDAKSFSFLGDFSAFATHSERSGLLRDLSTNFILRPVAYLTFHLNYRLDGMNPRGFRAVNIALHWANAFLLFLLLAHLLRSSPKQISLPPRSAPFIALAASLLFLVHPLQTESVTFVIQRFTSLGTFFYLATVLMYFLANAATGPKAAGGWRAGSVAALVLGMLSKEFVFTAPFLLVLLDWLVMGAPFKAALQRARFHCLCLPIIPVLIVLTAWAQNGGKFSFSAATHVAAHVIPPNYQYHYALTELSVVLAYLRLLLVPTGLNLDPDYPLSTSALEPRVVFSVVFIAGLVGAACWWHRRRPGDLRVSIVCLSVLWYFMTLGVDSSVVPLPDVMAEHRSYLPSIGALTALVCGVDLLRTRFANLPAMKHGLPLLTVVWIAALGVATRARNEVWRSEVGIWSDTVAKSPNKYRAWYNLGGAYLGENKIKEVVRCMGRAVALEPGHELSWIDLTAGLFVLGRYEECLKTAQLGLQNTGAGRLHYYIGVCHSNLGHVEKSIESLNKVEANDPNYAYSHSTLAINYTRLRQFDQALHHFRQAAALRPLTPDIQKVFDQVEAYMKHFPQTR